MSQPEHDALQFDSAVPAADATSDGPACGSCSRPIQVYYYEAAGQTICRKCKHALESAQGGAGKAGMGSMLGGMGLGALAALLGAAIYLGIAFGTGYEVGLIAVLVGWLVGKGVFVGSGRRGGLRFQIIATVFTYLAISVTYVPAMLVQLAEANGTMPADSAGMARMIDSLNTLAASDTTAIATLASADSSVLGDSLSALGQAASGEGDAALGVDESASAGEIVAFFALGAGVMLLIAPVKVIISDFPGSLLSVLIIGIGLVQAWQGARRQAVEIKGPFKLATDQPAGAAIETA